MLATMLHNTNAGSKPATMPTKPSTYILHFSRPYHHAQHYAGWTPGSVEARLKLHQSGRGSNLCRVAFEAGITLQIAQTWQHVDNHAARLHEHKLKNHGLARYCPVCKKLKEETDAK